MLINLIIIIYFLDVIETVLRSNQGSVDATIDQLLQISSENQNKDGMPSNVSINPLIFKIVHFYLNYYFQFFK